MPRSYRTKPAVRLSGGGGRLRQKPVWIDRAKRICGLCI